MGSITSWVRLEPRCRDDDMTEARAAPASTIRCGCWRGNGRRASFRARTPARRCSRAGGRQRADHALLRRRHQAQHATSARRATTPRAMPLEALVERQPLRTASDAGSLRLAVESGLHFLRMLDAQPTSRSYRADFLARFALLPPTERSAGGAGCARRCSYWKLMAQRALDARRLLAAFRDVRGTPRSAPRRPAASRAGDRAEVDAAIDAWLAQHDALFSAAAGRCAPMRGIPSGWSTPSRSRGAPGGEETPLTATQYAEGHLDWHSVDYRPGDQPRRGAGQGEHAAGARGDAGAGQLSRRARRSASGRSRTRRIDYGLLPAGPGDIAASHAERVRHQLRQRLVRHPDRSRRRHADASRARS